jgi:hypothetical protein
MDRYEMYDLEYKMEKLDRQREKLQYKIDAIEYERSEVYQEWERRSQHDRYVHTCVRCDRAKLASMIKVLDADISDNKLLCMVTSDEFVPHDDNIYRVKIEGKKADVICLGLDSVDAPCTGEYYVQRLPKWIQSKLAVLLMLDHQPPNCAVEGVGIRLDRNTFWVFKG